MTFLNGEEKPSLDDLAHHGVKGMKWGVRRTDGGTIAPHIHRRMVKAENNFQNKRSEANSKVASDRASGKTGSASAYRNEAKASQLNAQHRRNQQALRDMGLEIYKNVPEATKSAKISQTKQSNPQVFTRGEKAAVYLLTGPLVGHVIIKRNQRIHG